MAVTKITDLFCDYLNGYCSTNIWNEPQKEYRHNIKLTSQESRPKVSTWQRQGENVILPDSSNQYFVYMTPLDYFAGLDIGSTDWRSVSTLLTDTRVQLKFHDHTGKRLTSNKVFLKSSSINSDIILIAIDVAMLGQVSDQVAPENDIYIGVYFDSDEVNNITIADYTVSNINKAQIVAAAASASLKFVNGYAVRSMTSNTLKTGDLVELITDANILFSFSQDMANDTASRVYTARDGQSKFIIHIPKNKNPQNLIISHDTCDFYIYPRNSANKDYRGRFFHRCQGLEANSFIQLTHNDFGVPQALVDQFAGYCDSNEVVLECFVRSHSRTKHLVRDRNYLDFLYTLSDNQILDFLEGHGEANILFWRASTLESSNYISIVKDTSLQRLNYDLDDYTEALGYINTASLLSGRIYHYRGALAGTTFTQAVTLPIAYQWKTCPTCQAANSMLADTCKECNTDLSQVADLDAIVTINGKKVVYSKVSTQITAQLSAEGSNALKLVVTVNDINPTELQDTNEVLIEIVERKSFDSYVFSPVSGDNSFWFKTGEYNLYVQGSLGSSVMIPDGTSLTTGYTKLNLNTVAIEQFGVLSRITFNSSQYGKTYLLQSKEGAYFHYEDLASKLNGDENLVYIPKDSAQVITPIIFTPTAGTDTIDTGTCSDVELYQKVDGVYRKVRSVSRAWKNVTRGITTYLYTFSAAPIVGTPTYTNSSLCVNSGYLVTAVSESSITVNEKVYTRIAELDDTSSVEISHIGVNKRRLNFPTSFYGGEFLILQFNLQEVYVMESRNLIAYLNGRFLVENVDFWKVNVGAKLPPVYTFHNISYLDTTTNYLEMFESDMEEVIGTSNFIASDFINSKADPALFYNKFTNVYIGGKQHSQLSWSNGRLTTDSQIYSRKNNTSSVDDTNNGALYEIKTDLPKTVRSQMNETYLSADIERFQQIVHYFATLTPDDPAIYTMPCSHRLASIYLNSIIDAVLDGSLVLPANTDINYILPYLTEFEYLKEFDLPLKIQTTEELDINGNPTGRTLRTSIINRKYIDVYPSYKQRLTPESTLYRTFLALIDYMVPEDTVVDTVGVDTTVSTNRS